MTNPSDASVPDDVALLLEAWSNGDPSARDRLVTVVHDELRRLAHNFLRGEREHCTVHTSVLVNEAYLKLSTLREMRWRDRGHFFAMAATLMRRVLVDAARARQRDKRGGGVQLTSIDDRAAAPARALDVVALDDALARLSTLDPRQAQIVELRFFAGLNVEETAQALEISPATVKREWSTAKMWLYRELSHE